MPSRLATLALTTWIGAFGSFGCKGDVEENACFDQVSLVCNTCGTASFACEREEQAKRDYYESRATPKECKTLLAGTKAHLAAEGNELYCLAIQKQKFMNNAPGSAEQLQRLQERENKLRMAR